MTDPFSPGLLTRFPQPVRKVALLRASRIGDFICATPAFRALRAALPQAEIIMITLPLLRDLAVRLPYLDRYIAFPGFPGVAEQFFDARRAVAFFEHMQAEEFDLVVQMQGSGVYSNPFCLLLGGQATAGFIRPGDGPGRLAAALPFPETGHEVQRLLALTTFLGAPAQGEETEFPLWPEDHATAEDLLAQSDPPFIGLHPGAWARIRQWPLERFAGVGAGLRQQHGGTVVIVGGPDQRPLAEELAESLGPPVLNLAGRTSLPVLGGIITRLTVLITNDSGPAHVAYALGAPTVTIFGGEDLARYGPPQPGPYQILAHPVPCRPCGYAECPIGYPCLENVQVAQVIEAAEEAIATPGITRAFQWSTTSFKM